MAWFYLLIASIFEIIWAFFMKDSHGFSELTPSIITIITMLISFAFLGLAMRDLPLGTAYAVWTGIGTIGAFTIGILILGEPATFWRIICVTFIATGIIGLKLTSRIS